MSSPVSPLRPAFVEALKDAAQQFETPFYAYDLEAIRSRVAAIQQAFPRAKLFYAMKANPRLGILRRLREWGVLVEAVSMGELRRAYKAGFSPDQMVLNGLVKTVGDLSSLSGLGLPIIGLDSIAETERVARLLPGSRVIIRINPDLAISTHDHLATGRGSSKFGILPQDLPQALAVARAGGLEVLGLHVHLGSALAHAEDYHAGYKVMQKLYQDHGPFRVLNLGGGFGLDLDPASLAPLAQKLADDLGSELWLEPGRYLVAEAGVVVSKIWGTKRTRRNFVLTDAGMMTLLRPMLYGATHPVIPLYAGGPLQTYDLAGPVCESGDILARDVTLPEPNEGDAIAILQAGAYGSSMSSNYLDHPRPLEVLWTGSEWETLRTRQTWDQLLENEI